MQTPTEAMEPVIRAGIPTVVGGYTCQQAHGGGSVHVGCGGGTLTLERDGLKAAVVALVVAELEAMISGHVSGCPCPICQRLAAWRALVSEPAGEDK